MQKGIFVQFLTSVLFSDDSPEGGNFLKLQSVLRHWAAYCKDLYDVTLVDPEVLAPVRNKSNICF